MGGIRRSFPLSPGDPPPDAPEPSGVVAGAPFAIAASIGAGWRGSPRRPPSLGPRMDFEQVVRSQAGLLFWLSGHQYRLRAEDPKSAKPAREPTDIPIPPREVTALLDRGARQNADDPALAALLQRAKTELGASRSDSPRLMLFETRPKLLVSPPLVVKTPETPRKAGVAVEDLTFIEIEVVDEDGEPVSGMRYRLEMPDSTVQSGTIPKSGFLGFYKLEDPGLCHLKLLTTEQPAENKPAAEEKPRAKVAEKPAEAESATEPRAALVDGPFADEASENAAPLDDEPPVFIPDASPPPTAPETKLDFYDWPTWLVKAQRAGTNHIQAVLSGDGSDPRVAHQADFTAEADSGSLTRRR